MIIDLFKTGIYRDELKLNNQWLKKYCHDIKQNQDGTTLSNRGGFHSNNLNMNDASIRDLMKQIISSANVYSEQLGYSRVKMYNIWCNINSYRDHNQVHCHPNSKVSGVYYVKTPENCGEIEFHPPAYHVLEQSGLSRSDNFYTSISWWMPAEESILYLFPSWLMHLVRPNMNKEEERISFSFNLS